LSNGTPGTNYYLAGTALVPGSYSFAIEARDSLGNVGARPFTLTITRYTLLSSTTLPDASAGSAYSAPLFTTDAFGSVSWGQVSRAARSGRVERSHQRDAVRARQLQLHVDRGDGLPAPR
jgi:hypothetical protein